MIVSRNRYFDCWDWPVSLLLMLGCNSAYAIYCALYLRRAAEKARAKALGTMQETLSRIAAGNVAAGWRAEPEALREQIKMLIDEIQHTRQGAFVSLSRHPVVGAIFMPFGGAGILALLEYLATH